MSSVRSGPFDQKNTTYIVTGASLVNDLVTYTQSLSSALVQTGTFAAHANAALVTQGFLLVDTGKRLVPGQQPNVPTLLIGVNAIPVDSSGRRVGSFVGTTATAITGFIDPNSPNVAVYSRDRPTTFNDNLYFSGATNLNNAGNLMTNASLMGSSGATIFTESDKGNGVRHRGPGVFSGGALTASGGAIVSSGSLTVNTGLTASITNVSATTSVATYTAANTFLAGQVVTVSGLTAGQGGAFTVSPGTVSGAATANTLTYTCASAHGLTQGQIISISGMATAEYNVKNATVAGITSTLIFTVTVVGTVSSATSTANAATITSPNLNIVNGIIASASPTQFTVNGGFVVQASTASATGVATVYSTSTQSGIVVSGGPMIEKVVPTPIASGGTVATLDLSLGNVFTMYLTAATTITAVSNAPIGTLFYIALVGSGAFVLTLPANIIASVGTTTGNAAPAQAAATFRQLLTCVVVA